uniref:probable G-protein coupled receptor 156 n=1 Tax=Myxine glutinosa TaxID=7769 RepID=UPI00358F97DE
MQRNDSVWKREVEHRGVVVLGMLSGLGGVVTISGVTFLLRFHNHRPVRLGSPHLGIVSLLGSLVAYAAVPLLILPPSSPYAQVRAWLLCLGCTLTQGPLLAKTWRIQKIFSGHSVYNRSAMRDGRLLRGVVVVAISDLLLLSAWHVTTFYKPLHQVEPGGSSAWVQNWVWLGFLLFYKTLVPHYFLLKSCCWGQRWQLGETFTLHKANRDC